MKTSDFFSYLNKNFSTNDLKSLFQIFRQDPVLWNVAQQLPTLSRMKDKYGNATNNWSLTKLCITHLGLSDNILAKPVKDKLYFK